MSRIGKKSITIPEGVSVEIMEGNIVVKGKNGEIKTPILLGVKPVLNENILEFQLVKKTKQARSNWGTLRSLIASAIEGVSNGFEKTLILEGVGFKILKDGEDLDLSLGFSHTIKYKKPENVSFEVEKNMIKIKGFNKQVVGQVAAEIRALKKPEPYKGKGFRYSDEVVRRKVGKKAAKVGA